MHPLRRLLKYPRRYRGRYAAGMACSLVGLAAGLTVPWFIRAAINAIDRHEPMSAVTHLVAAMLGVALVRAIFVFAGRMTVISTARMAEYDIRNDLFRRLAELGPDFYRGQSAGDLTSRVINDIDQVRLMWGFGILGACGMTFTILLSMGMLFALNPTLAAIVLTPLALISIVVATTHRAQERHSESVQSTLGLISGAAYENFSGVRVVRAHTMEEDEKRRMAELCDSYVGANLRLAKVRGFSWALLMLLGEICVALTLWVGGRQMMDGTMSRGDLVAFTTYEFMLVWPMMAVGWLFSILQRATACARRLGEILDAVPSRPADGSKRGDGVAPRIEVRGLTFTYPGEARAALSDISIGFEPGRTVALVGLTGAGKTTLLRLLTGFYPAPPGTIFIDGRDIATLSIDAVRDCFSVVPQDNFLFSETLRYNLALGAQNGVTDEAIVGASKRARLHGEVEGFPGRYEAVIGERGITLSGGQRQRACLARALLREAPVLVLDDCFSSVDSQTEREILRELSAAAIAPTRIIVTHRLAAVEDADLIAVFNGGRIVERGRHAELMAARGLYAKLVERQRFLEEAERDEPA